MTVGAGIGVEHTRTEWRMDPAKSVRSPQNNQIDMLIVVAGSCVSCIYTEQLKVDARFQRLTCVLENSVEKKTKAERCVNFEQNCGRASE